jgi:hypothetical protein
MSLAHTVKKQVQIKNFKNLHVYYEKDYLCYFKVKLKPVLNPVAVK